MKSTKYSQFSLHIFKKIANRFFREDGEKNLLMEKANIGIHYEEYKALTCMNTLIAAISSITVALLLYLLFPSNSMLLLSLILVVCIPSIVGLIYWYYPSYRIKSRAADIDRFLPYSINFISTMSETGVSPGEIFRTLAKTDIYGEIQVEAKKIAKEIDIMGIDNITALKHGLERSPSKKFKAFLQGMIGTIQTGSDLSSFLTSSVDRYLRDDLLSRKKNLEFLGLIAELFVMAVIAFPLFLVIIIAVMGFIGKTTSTQFDVIYLIAFVMLPLAYYGFYVLIKSTTIQEIGKGKKEVASTFKELYENNRSSIHIIFFSIGSLIFLYLILVLLQTFGYLTLSFYHILEVLFLSFLVIIGPIGFHSYINDQKRKEIQNKFPDFLESVGNSLDSGMSVFDAIRTSSKGKYGKLTPELEKMKAELSWNIPVKTIFTNFARRMKNPLLKRAIITINRGIEMGGNTSKIFLAAAKEIRQVNDVREQRTANMSMY
ncbi:MAG TPA: hypothetical protein ENI44_03120, partial [Thermoplasmatales archaeon]|nr:hypothetical protein [Thermoplasmatales archaeon]